MTDTLTEAQQVLGRARHRAEARAKAHVPVDWDQFNREHRRLLGRLTRAVNSGDNANVVLACRDAVAAWDQPGMMWPDDWSRWQRALDDALGFHGYVDLKDLR